MPTPEQTAVIDTIERLLCARWNVAALDGPVANALAVVRSDGDLISALDGLVAELAERELYRWTAPVAAAIEELREAAPQRPRRGRAAAQETSPEATTDEGTE